MDVHFVEATNGPQNWGKFAVCRFTDDEWKVLSQVDGRPLLAGRGWSREHTLIVDLQTGEGAFFPEWVHKSDLDKHAIWVCPMFEHALLKILAGDHDPMKTEPLIDFPDAPFEYAGYRRGGPQLHALRQAATVVSEAWDRYVGTEDTEGEDDVDGMADAIAQLRELLGNDIT